LVEGLGHCGMCHTAINMLDGSSESKAFQGRADVDQFPFPTISAARYLNSIGSGLSTTACPPIRWKRSSRREITSRSWAGSHRKRGRKLQSALRRLYRCHCGSPPRCHGPGTGIFGNESSCPCRKSYPDVMMVQPADDRQRNNASGSLDGSRQRRVLGQGQVCSGAVVV
jgi:hypothetical protein